VFFIFPGDCKETFSLFTVCEISRNSAHVFENVIRN